jgi:Ca2+/H+ antiporter
MMPHPDREDIPRQYDSTTLLQEVLSSTQLMFQNRITWLLLLGPIALVGDATGVMGEPLCFAFSGIALIPCAERLSYVTEQVAAHTNGTIGALLNATFGNAPELLISTAALRSGFYRVTQLAMLGSMLTNLLFVFGLSCLVGGARYQVQELRITSGNVSVGMLLAATAGSLLPAALIMSGQLSQEGDKKSDNNLPSQEELSFSRVNAAIMMFLYMAYLTFQLGTHKEEFDEEDNVVETEHHLLLFTPHYIMRNHGQKRRSQRNMFCLKYLFGGEDSHLRDDDRDFPYQSPGGDVEMVVSSDHLSQVSSDESALDPEDIVMPPPNDDHSSLPSRTQRGRRRTKPVRPRRTVSYDDKDNGDRKTPPRDIVDDDGHCVRDKSHESDAPRMSHQEDFGNGGKCFRSRFYLLSILP